MTNDNYVYVHRSKEDGVIFYIGHGRLDRCKTKNKRSFTWQEKAKLGFEVEYLHVNLTKEKAVQIENQYLTNPDQSWKLINISPSRKVKDFSREMFFDLTYDPTSKSGLRWNKKKKGNFKNDLQAGHLSKKGYWQVRVNKKLHLAHRVIWVILNGSINSELVINHIDNNPSNNLIDNLELVTQAVNSRKSKLNVNPLNTGILHSTMKSGYDYWMAFYYDLNSKRVSKSFNCKKLGYEKARELATEWRKTKLFELNEKGAGYNV